MRLSGEWQVVSGNDYDVSRRVGTAAMRNRQFTRHSSAFTLIELLIVISILAILAALLLGVAARAGERGREARTKAMIARIHTLVMEHYDTYKDRRAPLNENNATLRALTGQPRALARLYAIRELMLMEIPDRWSDVLLGAVDNVSMASDVGQPVYLPPNLSSTYFGPTPIVEAYRRQYFSMLGAGVDRETIKRNQGAECLYMFVMIATADGEARSLFNESSIGDTDGDGAPEFLDGWGNPISFIRWPVGFESDLQLNARNLGDPTSQEWLNGASADHDPFDVFRVDLPAFRMVPLIYSAGGDERYDLYTARDTTVWPLGASNSQLNPYNLVNSVEGDFYLGTPMNEAGNQVDPTAAADNINNHNITSE